MVVSCSSRDQATRRETEVEEPRLVFEALSEGTERKDRGRKADDYRRCPSLEEHVLVATEYRRVEVYRRTTKGWGLFRFYGPPDDVELTSLGVRLPVAAIYHRRDVSETPPE